MKLGRKHLADIHRIANEMFRLCPSDTGLVNSPQCGDEDISDACIKCWVNATEEFKDVD